MNTRDLSQNPASSGSQKAGEHGSASSHFTSNSEFLIKNIHIFSDKCIQEDQRKKLLNSKENGQRNMIYQFFFVNYLLSICIVDVVQEASKCFTDVDNGPNPGDGTDNKGSKKKAGNAGTQQQKSSLLEIAGGVRSVSQKIFIILIKLLEALSDKDLNCRIDEIISNRVATFKKFDEHQQMVQNDATGVILSSGDSNEPKKSRKMSMSKEEEDPTANTNSATLTITKMILFNLDKLLKISK